MLRVEPKVTPELKGAKTFGFKSKNNYRTRSSYFGTIDSQRHQDDVIKNIRMILEKLKLTPCEVDLEISVENGRTSRVGQIRPYDQLSMEKSMAIAEEADKATFDFSRKYPKSKFTVVYHQTIELYNIVY